MINQNKSLKCNCCGHEWVSSEYLVHSILPKTCPKCKNYYWNEIKNAKN